MSEKEKGLELLALLPPESKGYTLMHSPFSGWHICRVMADGQVKELSCVDAEIKLIISKSKGDAQ